VKNYIQLPTADSQYNYKAYSIYIDRVFSCKCIGVAKALKKTKYLTYANFHSVVECRNSITNSLVWSRNK